MEIEDLRIKQAEFEGTRQELKGETSKLKNERQKFLKLFSENKLSSLAIDDFVVGKGNENSFCYWLENKLKGLGDIHGATSTKFGVYYAKANSEYIPTSRFGSNGIEAFHNVKSAIISLLNSAKVWRINEIKENILSPMFKGKILSTYFPEKFLNIFATEHLEYFLDKLDIPYSDSSDEIDKRISLMKFKNNDTVMKDWSIYEFSKFLYEKLGRPLKIENVPEELREYLLIKYPPLNKVNAKFVELEPVELSTAKKKSSNPEIRVRAPIDFEKENKINKKIGERGELIVLKAEKEYLRSIGKEELANRVRHISKESDSAGYDILSFDKNGNEVCIEVKSTRQKVGNANFLITSNEFNWAKKLENYFIYIVFEATTPSPRILRLRKPFDLPKEKIQITPISYRVVINLKEV